MTNLKVKRDHEWGVLLLVFHPSTHPPICWDESRSGVLPKGQHSWNISVMKEARLDQKVFLDSLMECPSWGIFFARKQIVKTNKPTSKPDLVSKAQRPTNLFKLCLVKL